MDPEEFEKVHVHQVYEEIADHFSRTRYKPWPLITRFLSSLPPGSVGLDAGCGNGKYMPFRSVLVPPPARSEDAPPENTTRKKKGKRRDFEADRGDGGKVEEVVEVPVVPSSNVLSIGLDRSLQLLKLAQTNGHDPDPDSRKAEGQGEGEGESKNKGGANEVLWGDAIELGCFRDGIFDFAISIATIHHFGTEERRQEAVRQLISTVSPRGGRVLIYVWAFEQGEGSKVRLGSRTKGINEATTTAATSAHEDARGGGSNEQDVFVPWKLQQSASFGDREQGSAAGNGGEKVLKRYYHLYREGELERDVLKVAEGLPCKVVGKGWERDNWWIEVERM